jgi:hypothetical protein
MTERRQRVVEDWVTRNHVESRLVLAIALFMLGWVTKWSMAFPVESKFDGLGTAAIIAAVQVPATWFIQNAYATWKDLTK